MTDTVTHCASVDRRFTLRWDKTNKRWKKFYKGKQFYFVPPSRTKDPEEYQICVTEWVKTKEKFDRENTGESEAASDTFNREVSSSLPDREFGRHRPRTGTALCVDKRYYSELKRNAEKRGIPFDVTRKHLSQLYMKQKGRCALTGERIFLRGGEECGLPLRLRTASIDRVDSSIGYVEGNLQWVHKKINMMKGSLAASEFIELCQAVVVNFHTQLSKNHR